MNSNISRKYALELVLDMGLAESKPTGTLLKFSRKLTSVEYDKAFNPESLSYDELLKDKSMYQRTIERFIYFTRLDLICILWFKL